MHHLLILVEKAASILSQPNSFISVEKGYQQNTSIKLSFIAPTIEGFNLQVQLLKGSNISLLCRNNRLLQIKQSLGTVFSLTMNSINKTWERNIIGKASRYIWSFKRQNIGVDKEILIT